MKCSRRWSKRARPSKMTRRCALSCSRAKAVASARASTLAAFRRWPAAGARAKESSGKDPSAVRAAKRLLNDASRRTLAEGFAAERQEIGALIGTPNQVEAIKAYFEKRDPVFVDPQ